MLYKQYHEMQTGQWQPTARQFYTGNASIARHLLVEAGGFDETFRRAEDVELAYRLEARGLRFVFNADAIGYHYAERSFRSWLEIPYMYGRNDVIFFRDKEQSWLLGTVKEEFRYRNAFIKALVHFCVGRHAVNTQMQSGLKAAVVVGERLGSDHLVRAALSGVFNLRYYEGFSDELGGRKQFLAQVAQSGI